MSRLPLRSLAMVGLLGLGVSAWAQPAGSIRSVRTLKTSGAVEIEIDGSNRLVPQTRVLTAPDRLVIDFPDTTPGAQLRTQTVNQGDVKSFRVGLFQSKPPVTRVVVDLSSPQSFQVFPDGRTVMIKLTASQTAQAKAPEPAADPGPLDDFPPAISVPKANTSAAPEPANLASIPLAVTFHDGLLFIHANKASLSEVLFAVHQKTGADVDIAAGAEQEKVVTDIGPAPAPEVLNQLLNGSRFNFLIVSAPNNPNALDRVILTMRSGGVSAPVPSAGEGPEPQPPVAALQRTPPDTTQAPPDTTPDNPD